MARSRNIKPGFFTNDVLAEIEPLGRLLFQGLWCIADREGRVEDRPKKIKAELLPYDDCNADDLLQQLSDREFILRYVADGKRFIQVLNFAKHQNPHVKEPASLIPAPDMSGSSPVLELEIPEAAGLIPDSLNLIPDSGFPFPDSLTHVPKPASLSSVAKKPESNSAETWSVYSTAYLGRYGTEPVRNATVNSQLSNFVKRLGAQEAPAVAAWYVSHNGRYYVQNCHPVSAMLKDAEKLRTEWATRRQVTAAEAMQADKTQTNLNSFAPMIEEARRREAKEAANA